MTQKSYAVVGGGASGIATAYYLQQQGFKVELIERGERLGGRIATCKMGDRQIAMGGKNIGKGYHLFREFTEAMGNNPYEFFGLNSSQVRNGKIVTLDGSKRWRGIFQLLGSFSPKDIFHFLQMCAAIKRNEDNGYLGGSYFNSLIKKLGDRRVSNFFGKAFCQRLIRPMSVRMNGAEPDEVYVGNLGSNIRMILDTYEQLSHGIDPVLEKLTETVSVRLGTTVKSLLVAGNRVIGLEMVDQDGVHQQQYDGVILATPASVTAKLVASSNPSLAEILRRVCYYPVMVIVAEYQRDIFSEQTRALVFNAEEPLSNAGSYGINDRHIVRYTFSGRAARPYIESDMDAAKLLEIAEEALNRYIPVDASERIQFVSQRMSTGLCAYTHNYPEFDRSIQSQLKTLPGLEITGDYIQGASIEACFRAAQASVERVTRANKLEAETAASHNLVSV
ncbi:MAG: FAD-dependent oxidoreductase [Xenococcaceae cyanobacterium MO_188.B19]|nr:FAD-dependent oxidoreductase [Xenococcaceae cyanobacterium MO_188.B19]